MKTTVFNTSLARRAAARFLNVLYAAKAINPLRLALTSETKIVTRIAVLGTNLGWAFVTAALMAIGAATGPMSAATIPVTSTADDGSAGTLRSALSIAADGDTIDATGISGTITLTNGQLIVTNSVQILGPGANVLAVNGNAAGRVFYVGGGKTVTIADLTITNGQVSGNFPGGTGGGIFNDQSILTVSNCTVSGNRSDNAGGGIFNSGFNSSANLKIVNSTLNGNSSDGNGAGIYNSEPGILEIINSTISGNSASLNGGGIFNFRLFGSATMRIVNSTLSGNTAGNNGADIHNRGGTVDIGSTILNAGGIWNTNGGNVTSLGHNLSSDGGGGFLTNATDQINTDPMLGPLRDNGGPTFTHAPSCGSPALDAGTNFTSSATDQRGAPRTFDIASIANAAGGDGTDIGAVESSVGLFTVLNTNDSGAGSLREAISNANDSLGSDIIDFATNAFGTITLTSGELLITDCLIVNGPGATNVVINGGFPATTNRVFHVSSNIVVTIAGLTISNGSASGGGIPNNYGGGIYHDHSALIISNCTISDNSAEFGGGIYNNGISGSATLTITNSALSGNSARSGGSIYNDGFNNGSATLTIANCTISGNSAGASGGGGIVNDAFGGGTGTVTIANSTLNGNSATRSGDSILNIDSFGGSATVEIGSTILNTGSSGTNFFNETGTIRSLGYNLSSDSGSGFLIQPTDLTNTNAMLGPLQLNGGHTPTHALLCGSPAIDKGTNFSGSATDQTGFPRTFNVPAIANAGDGTDIGAYELLNTTPVAQSKSATLTASTNCTVTVTPSDVDNGSYDPDGDTLAKFVSPTNLTGSGMHTVTLIVTDCHGASNSCTATVTVADITLPSLTCPSNQTVNATGPSGAVTNYPAGATDACGTPVVTYDIAGTPITWPYNFQIGDTTVNVTATDAATNVASCSFNVHVKGAVEQINDLIAKINALPGVKSPNKKALVSPLQTALAALAAKDKPSACKAMQAFINLVKAQAEKKLISAEAATGMITDAMRIRAVIGCP